MDEMGFCAFASAANVARRAIVTLEEAEAALTTLAAPDPDSSDPENDGRRVERVPGGWVVLNAIKYRDLVTRAIIQEQTRERVRKYRAKQNGNAPVTDPSVTETHVTKSNDLVTPSEARARAVAKARSEATTEEKKEQAGVISTSGAPESAWDTVLKNQRKKGRYRVRVR